ncbi:RodZ domain-containing protein [Methylophaga sp. UBA2689]|jgi:cytoskeleton protein RodZ|uniref:RodZ domain-containing protein n=1 Tax=Methylophaga sp. UBA2689 TaxID=1946878 RepID=UPI0025F2899E|nr:RodZ domain-containing protein [Methylophaga sp. UBA2689]|tara:strand:- start:81 stop:1001 length:921 start_codon:yes stop_codon:yes gene_type:complete
MTESHSEEPNVVSSSVDVGRRLREAREAKKISISDAAAQLRVTRSAIVHLEEQDWDKLHGRTYARGYFLSYTKFLGLPQDEMLAGFNIEFTETDKRSPSVAPIQQIKPAKSTFPWLPLILLITVAVLTWFAYQQWQATKLVQNNEPAEQTLLEPLNETANENNADPVPITESNEISLEEQPLIPNETDTSEPSLDTADTALDESFETETSPPVEDAESATAEATTEKNLIIGINADCWVEVRDASQQVLISRVVRAGNTVELTGTLPLQVSLGQANAASVRFDGDIIDITEYTRGNVARFTLGEDS